MILEKFYKNSDFGKWQKHRGFTKITDDNIHLYMPIYQKDVLCRDGRCNECIGEFPVYINEDDILNGGVRHKKCLRFENYKKDSMRKINSGRYLKSLRIPDRYLNTTWSSLDRPIPQAIKEIQDFTNNFPHNQPPGIYIYGEDNESGKTSLMWLIIRTLLETGKIKKFVFKKAGLFADEIKEDIEKNSSSFFDRCLTSEVLMIDDFGRERATNFIAERIYTILDNRWENSLPTILASHIPLDRSIWIKDRERDIYSRIKNSCKLVNLQLSGENTASE